jgi:hypothetical protein
MTEVYVVVVNDRRGGIETFVFSTPEAAVDYARGVTSDYPHGVEERTIPGWLYCAWYGESSVWALERKIDPFTSKGGSDK